MTTQGKIPKFSTLLFDGDTFAFVAAAAVQTVVNEGDGIYTTFASFDEGRMVLDNLIATSALLTGSPEATRKFFLSDSANWRKDVFADYKMNRKDSDRPVLLNPLKDYLREYHDALSFSNLEADDIIGIEMTNGENGDAPCTVGRDKDFKTIPGWHFRIQTTTPFFMKEHEANAFFYTQVLAGDRVDGFAGAKGIGMKRAEQIVASLEKVVPQRGVITRGKNKGKEVIKWFSEPCEDIWEVIVTHFEKSGSDEREALLTARLANILRADQWNRESGSIKLWEPSMWRNVKPW
jgi:5'-3' exonuclease